MDLGYKRLRMLYISLQEMLKDVQIEWIRWIIILVRGFDILCCMEVEFYGELLMVVSHEVCGWVEVQ